MEMTDTTYKYRELARIVIEALTPLRVGTGSADLKTKSPVIKDINGLPYIPGTSLCGVLRHAYTGDTNIFGNQSYGSKLYITDGVLVGADGLAIDGLCLKRDSYIDKYEDLPIRTHCRINGKGTNMHTGVFTEQVVYQGTRFVFEVELVHSEPDPKTNKCPNLLKDVLSSLNNIDFSIGGGKHHGFGRVKVVSSHYRGLNLSECADLDLYLAKSASLSAIWNGWEGLSLEKNSSKSIKSYTLLLQPYGPFLFSSGSKDKDVDNTSTKELVVEWDGCKGAFCEKPRVLIPGTSIKGAISHRTAYHYNKASGVYSDSKTREELEDSEYLNPAIVALFGSEGTKEDTRGKVGKVTVSDVMLKDTTDVILQHLKVDSFTGGNIDGALFSEKASYTTKQFVINVTVNTDGVEKAHLDALEASLKDICNGTLPLGGGVNKGHGIFTGILKRD